MNDKIEVLADSHRGVYLPEVWIRNLPDYTAWHISENTYNVIAAGVDAEAHADYFWDTWCRVLDTAFFVDEEGFKWFLHQDGDLFAYREDADTTELFGDY